MRGARKEKVTYNINIKQKTHHAVAPLWPKVCEGYSKTSFLRKHSIWLTRSDTLGGNIVSGLRETILFEEKVHVS